MSKLSQLSSTLEFVEPVRRVGRVANVGAGIVTVTGLLDCAHIADQVSIVRRRGPAILGEVVGMKGSSLSILPENTLDGVSSGDRVILLGSSDIAPDVSWLGRVMDPFARPMDGRPLMRGIAPRPVHNAPPPATERRGLGGRLETSMAVFDTFLPLARGQRLGLFAGSGVGKSTLLGRFAQRVQADVIVLALIGERGKEVGDFVHNILGPAGMARSVVVAATSDQAPQVRRRAAWSAMTIAEYFRDEGFSVLLMTDSLTRFAEAHREVATAAGEASNLRGFPASTSHQIMSLCERAGPGWAEKGDITAVFSVLVAGSDMEGPIADIVRGVLDGHVVLDREIAERGRYPAVDVLRSVSRSLPHVATEEQNQVLTDARAVLSKYDKSELMIQAGIYQAGTDKALDQAVRIWPLLDQFTARSSDSIESSFSVLSKILSQRGGDPKPVILADSVPKSQ